MSHPQSAAWVVLGSLNMDLVARAAQLPAAGQTVAGRQLLTLPGGKGANQALAAARDGAAVALWGHVGDDAYGAALRTQLQSEGVGLRALGQASGSSGVALIVVDDAGQNQITVVPGANAATDVAYVQRCLAQQGVPPLMLAQLEVPVRAVLSAFAAVRAAGGVTVLNPSPLDAWCDELLAHTDVLIVNEHEAAWLGARLGHPLTDEVRPGGLQALVISLGGDGLRVVLPDTELRLSGHTVAVVDTVGAGDCLAGVLSARLAHTPLPWIADSWRAAACAANAAAALSVTQVGAQTAPTRAQTNAWLAQR
jgi:ribokinase